MYLKEENEEEGGLDVGEEEEFFSLPSSSIAFVNTGGRIGEFEPTMQSRYSMRSRRKQYFDIWVYLSRSKSDRPISQANRCDAAANEFAQVPQLENSFPNLRNM